MAPISLCNLGGKFEHKAVLNLSDDLFFWSSPNFGPKAGLNLNGDLSIFFGLHLILGPKTGLNLSGEFFLLVFIILKFPGPISFKNPAYAGGLRK